MPELVLTYLDLPGRAEGIRQALKIAGVPFTDKRLSRDELTKMKPSFPYKKVPVMSVDGDVVAETLAILRLAGKLGGMYPPSTEPLACLAIDEILDMCDDLFERLMMPSLIETDAENKKQMRLDMLKGPLPQALERLDKRLADLESHPFFKANADALFVHHIVCNDWVGFFRSGMLDHIPVDMIDKYKTFVALFDIVDKTLSVNQQVQPAASTLPLPVPQKLKLTYFDMPGRAEQIRLALHIGGIKFEDERISYQEFTQRKSEFPNGQVPVLSIDGHAYCQSFALLRYVGSLTGLYPVNNAVDAAKVDEIFSHLGELYYAMDPSFVEQDLEKKRKMREELMANTIPQSLENLNERIAYFKQQKKSDRPFAMGGEKLTVADLVVYAVVQFFKSGFVDHVPTSVVDPYTHILQSSEAVAKHPRVLDWYAQSPQTSAFVERLQMSTDED